MCSYYYTYMYSRTMIVGITAVGLLASTAVATSGTAVVDLVVDVHACQQPHIYIVAARRGRGAVDYSSRSTAVVG